MGKKVTDYLEHSPILLGESYQDKKEVFAAVHKMVFESGWVTKDFAKKILEREETFPTGIDQGDFGVAIPHTDPEWVKEEFIALIIPNHPVLFQRMDDIEQDVPADFIFILGLNQPHEQLAMLQNLMQLIQNTELLKSLYQERNRVDILSLLKEYDF
ncbi:PTS sugar transporter subunit IIA [Tetragenococcus koreensis]|uniref:PTS sugar transporter IIA component n=1 Tax=Tetragenococcus koreensis TaxID=290335 RepID=A0AAN4UA62_9ENTE|nr:PTS sugar transporter subunit IIA [Tetragenococcus koreensis]MCF1585963.1 PTS sugar transporter subunit IIA [Tetragenococcus koreensis]MCF1615549.1 PTS sugar transporter subunit IIA [Tetragenococcus koreensis]MCF1620605.1 PTS sugar transporter subunit IIA [Tetragenococcus koreensis]MCF1625346.1 PTS sugar transporter subunit IIA [Tetragenococcus koreensis]MCF1627981.1 PTS sugar transporter subunit IIA [Tetragenococcus koreensis]